MRPIQQQETPKKTALTPPREVWIVPWANIVYYENEPVMDNLVRYVLASSSAGVEEARIRLEEAKKWNDLPPREITLDHEYHIGFDPRCLRCRVRRVIELERQASGVEEASDLTLLGNYHHTPPDGTLRCHFCGGTGPKGVDDEHRVFHKDNNCPALIAERQASGPGETE